VRSGEIKKVGRFKVEERRKVGSVDCWINGRMLKNEF